MPIDLRSDTVTLPSPEMREAMASAVVGDDVYGEDPTVNELEALGATMLGKEAALFVSSGTQGNLIGVMCHCGRGDEYIAGAESHLYRSEAGGAAVLGGISPFTVPVHPDGTLDPAAVEAAIKPDDVHMPITRLLCLENTHKGMVLPLDYLDRVGKLARRHGLALHVDGARLFNAATKLQVPPAALVRHSDTVSVCLSKGLAAPVGSLLCGTAATIRKARRIRKMLGGGMRQAGILAAAGIVALTSMIDRLDEDHRNAATLAEGLAGVRGVTVDPAGVQTNMVFFELDAGLAKVFQRWMAERGVIIGGGLGRIRAVTHYGITATDVEATVAAARSCSERHL